MILILNTVQSEGPSLPQEKKWLLAEYIWAYIINNIIYYAYIIQIHINVYLVVNYLLEIPSVLSTLKSLIMLPEMRYGIPRWNRLVLETARVIYW